MAFKKQKSRKQLTWVKRLDIVWAWSPLPAVTDGILLEIGVCFRGFVGTRVSFDGVERFQLQRKGIASAMRSLWVLDVLLQRLRPHLSRSSQVLKSLHSHSMLLKVRMCCHKLRCSHVEQECSPNSNLVKTIKMLT